MIITHDMGMVLIYIGLIIISPFIACFSWYASRYFLDLYIADEILIINYFENGKSVSEIKISAMTDGRVAEKILAAKESCHE